MKTNSKSQKTVYLVELALLIAVIVIMAFTPIGFIKTMGLEITLIVVPVAVGATLLGPKGGAVLGGVFGLVSFIQCFGFSPFGAVLLGMDAFKTFLTCFIPRLLTGFLTGLIYVGIKKTKAKGFAELIANLCCPLLNTIFFMTFLTSFFYATDYIRGFADSLGARNPFMFIILFVGINGLFEAAACFIIGSAVSKALVHVNNKQLARV